MKKNCRPDVTRPVARQLPLALSSAKRRLLSLLFMIEVLGLSAAHAASPSSGATDRSLLATTEPISASGPIASPVPGQPTSTREKLNDPHFGSSLRGTGVVPARFSDVITFDDVAAGSPVTDRYRDRGIIFGGSGPVTVEDSAAPASPVLSGTPILEGDITGYFVRPGTDEPATVYFLGWNIGFLDSAESVRMDFFGAAGEPLFSLQNPRTGYLRYAARGGSAGIASWRFHIVATELAGFGIDDLFFSVPGEDDTDREKGLSACAEGNPVNPAVGNKFQLETDYQGLRPLPLTVSRSYNSIDGFWRFFPEIRYREGGRTVQVIRADGKGLTFTGARGSDNWLATSTDITGKLTSARDTSGNVTGWTYRSIDDQVEHYNAQGKLLRLQSRVGLGQTWHYSAGEIKVTHDLGGSLTFAVNTLGQIVSVIDPAGNAWLYRYNDNGLLEDVIFPADSGTQIYHYENTLFPDLLTGITDAEGNRYATWNYDDQRRAISSEHAGGAGLTRFDYTYTNDPLYPQTTVTNALGKQSTYHYITVNGARKVFYVSGHASDYCVASNQQYTFDANAFIASYTDWNGNLTTFTRDEKGRELSRTEAVGTAQERRVTKQWHPDFNLPEIITEPGRRTVYRYDALGNEVERNIIDTSDAT